MRMEKVAEFNERDFHYFQQFQLSHFLNFACLFPSSQQKQHYNKLNWIENRFQIRALRFMYGQ